MAKTPKKKTDVDTSSEKDAVEAKAEDIVDAEIIEETPPPDADGPADGDDTTAAGDDGSPAEENSDVTVSAEACDADKDATTDGDGADNDSIEGDVAEDTIASEPDQDAVTLASSDAEDTIAPEAEAVETAEPEPAPPVVTNTVAEPQTSGFFPLLAGGAIAAALGFVGAQYPDEWPFAGGRDGVAPEVQTALDAQSDNIDALGSRIDELAAVEVPTVDLSPVEASLAGLGDRLDGVEATLGALSEAAEDLNNRVNAIERAPVEATVPPDAIESYERELETLREAIAAQRAEIENIATRAVEAEQNANDRAALARARAAYAEIAAALESGTSFSAPLDVASAAAGGSTSEALSTVATDGVATQRALVEEFPDAARAALAVARSGASEDGAVTTFLLRQLGARSVTPREGEGPDAVLSRAEAAVRAGNLDAALNEIDTLPDNVKAALGSWPERARARLDALSAAEALGQELQDK